MIVEDYIEDNIPLLCSRTMATSTLQFLANLIYTLASSSYDQSEVLQAMMQQLSLLNVQVSSIATSTVTLIPALNAVQPKDFLTVGMGFVGVIVGGAITYAANWHLNRWTQRASIASRRKEELFQPLYDEVRQLQRVLSTERPGALYFSTARDGSIVEVVDRDIRATVGRWRQFKASSRHTEVPSNIAADLDQIETVMLAFVAALQELEKDVESIRIPSAEIIALYQREQFNRDTSFTYLWAGELLNTDDAQRLVTSRAKLFDRSQEREALIEATRVAIHKAYNLPALHEAKRRLTQFRAAISLTVADLETLIRQIVKKYEYGEHLV